MDEWKGYPKIAILATLENTLLTSQVSQLKDYGSLSEFATDPSMMFTALGCLIFIVSSFGVLGSLRENICLLRIYKIFLLVIIVFEFCAGKMCLCVCLCVCACVYSSVWPCVYFFVCGCVCERVKFLLFLDPVFGSHILNSFARIYIYIYTKNSSKFTKDKR